MMLYQLYSAYSTSNVLTYKYKTIFSHNTRQVIELPVKKERQEGSINFIWIDNEKKLCLLFKGLFGEYGKIS